MGNRLNKMIATTCVINFMIVCFVVLDQMSARREILRLHPVEPY
jgi:hypothetical protein